MSDVDDQAEPTESASDDTLQITPLRPAIRAFSMRRLLNRASAAVAGILLLALAIHWLPGALGPQVRPQPTRAGDSFRYGTLPPGRSDSGPTRGSGWKPIGPGWAEDIAFSADGRVGYVCGALGPGDAPVLVARFDTATLSRNTWQRYTNPASGPECRVSVSPADAADVALVVENCSGAACNGRIPSSQVYRSYDSGTTWRRVDLPSSLLVGDMAWANSTLFLSAADYTASRQPPYMLFVSGADGSLTSLGARELLGRSTPLGYILLRSNGTTLYAALTELTCSNDCLTWLRTDDAGRHWTSFSGRYRDSLLMVVAAQPGSPAAIGTIFAPETETLVPLRTADSGQHWATLPPFPTNPSTGGAVIYTVPDGTAYAFCFGDANVVYALSAGATRWLTVAPLPTGDPVAVQYDASGHVVALWGRAIKPTSELGLEYYPLAPSR